MASSTGGQRLALAATYADAFKSLEQGGIDGPSVRAYEVYADGADTLVRVTFQTAKTAWANATAYKKGDERSQSFSSGLGAYTVNFRALVDHTSATATDQPGSGSSWTSKWEYAGSATRIYYVKDGRALPIIVDSRVKNSGKIQRVEIVNAAGVAAGYAVCNPFMTVMEK